MPSLNRLQQEMGPKGLVVLGVSIDENAHYYSQFIHSWEIKFPTVREPSRDTMIRYGTERVPETYLIGPDGIVLRKFVNYQDWGSLEITNYLHSLL
jgi:peroxiredoxin